MNMTIGLRFCAKNRHGPPTSGFFVVPYIYFDPKKEKTPSYLTLEQRRIFQIDWWWWFLIKNRIMITKYEKLQQELKRNQKTQYSYMTLQGIE